MGGKIAKCGAEGARAIGPAIWPLLATISIGGILCFFANGENHKYLKYLILLISGTSQMGEKIAKCGAKGARAIGRDIWQLSATISIGGRHCFCANGENYKYL